MEAFLLDASFFIIPMGAIGGLIYFLTTNHPKPIKEIIFKALKYYSVYQIVFSVLILLCIFLIEWDISKQTYWIRRALNDVSLLLKFVFFTPPMLALPSIILFFIYLIYRIFREFYLGNWHIEMIKKNIVKFKIMLILVIVVIVGILCFYKNTSDIDRWVFRGNKNLTSIIIPNNVTTIGEYAFNGYTGLKSIIIPNSVTTIGDSAFNGCTNLTDVTIGNGVTTIEHFAFNDCTSLTSITIPNSVTTIGGNAFRGCTSLKEFIVSEENTKYAAIDGVLFNKDKTFLINYPDNNSVSYTVPNSVTTIGRWAFNDCTSLTSITIPNRVTTIENRTFEGCTSLKEIHNKNSIPQEKDEMDYSGFNGIDMKTCVLYVPKGSYNAYRNAPVWSEFENIIEE